MGGRLQTTKARESLVAIDKWTEEQLRQFVQKEITRAQPSKELPVNPPPGALALFNGTNWDGHACGFGQGLYSWGLGGGAKSQNTTIAHRLGIAPSIVLILVEASGTEGGITPMLVSKDVTNFVSYCEYGVGTGTGGQSRNFYWLAIA